MHIQQLTGNAVVLQVDASTTTCNGLKRLIAEHPSLGIPERQQHLVCAGKVLQSGRGSEQSEEEPVLATLGVEDESIIHLCAIIPGYIPIRVISEDTAGVHVAAINIERRATIETLKGKLSIRNDLQPFHYLYIFPHHRILPEGRIIQLGLPFAWPALAVLGKRLRGPDEVSIGFSTSPHRHNGPHSLADYGIEREVTLYLISRQQIVFGLACWFAMVVATLSMGLDGYNFATIMLRAVRSTGTFVWRLGVLLLTGVWTFRQTGDEIMLVIRRP